MNDKCNFKLTIKQFKSGLYDVTLTNFEKQQPETTNDKKDTIEDLVSWIEDAEKTTGIIFEEMVNLGAIEFDMNFYKKNSLINQINNALNEAGQDHMDDTDQEDDYTVENIEKIYITKENDNSYTLTDQDGNILEENLESLYPEIYYYQKSMGLENYSLDRLVELGYIVTSNETTKKQINNIILFPVVNNGEEATHEIDSIKVVYNDNSTEIKHISEFSNLVKELIEKSKYKDEKNPLDSLIRNNVISLNLTGNENNYGKNLRSVKLNSIGELVAISNFKRKKTSLTDNPELVYDILCSLSSQNNIASVVKLMDDGLLKISTAKEKNKTEEIETLPVQIVFGKYIDQNKNIGYKYYAVYDKNNYQEITKSEAVNYFNRLATKKKITEKKVERMFEKEFCKIIPLAAVEDYVKNSPKVKPKRKSFFSIFRKNREKEEDIIKDSNKAKTKKVGFFTKLKKPLVILTTLAVATVTACGAFLSRKYSEFFNKVKEPNSASDSATPGMITDPAEENNTLANSNINMNIQNKEYKDLLNKCKGNENRRNAMLAVGKYLEQYNNLTPVKANNGELSHNFDEAFAQYLAYNDISESKYNDIMGNQTTALTKFQVDLLKSIDEDAKMHLIQTEPMGKELIIESETGKSLYQKYENLFIAMNTTTDNNVKKEYAEKFYDMVREDLKVVADNNYENIEDYMFIIEEFRLAMSMSPISTENEFTDLDSEYIHNLMDKIFNRKIVSRLQQAELSNQAQIAVDKYYGNEFEELYPTIDDFKDATQKDVFVSTPSTIPLFPEYEENNNNISIESTQEQNNSSDNNENNYKPEQNNSSVNNENNYTPETNYSETYTPTGDTECIITDNIIDNIAPGKAEVTLSPDDMEIIDQEIIIPQEPVQDTTVSEDDVLIEKDYYDKGVIDENGNVYDCYENINTTDIGNCEVYDQNDPLPDPNAVSTSSSLNNEQLADMIVESMAAYDYPVTSSAKVYHL